MKKTQEEARRILANHAEALRELPAIRRVMFYYSGGPDPIGEMAAQMRDPVHLSLMKHAQERVDELTAVILVNIGKVLEDPDLEFRARAMQAFETSFARQGIADGSYAPPKPVAVR